MGFHEKDKWWVSPSNYEPEVVEKFNFPKKVEFLDTTLRDGEQQPGIIFTKDEKVAIAKRLSEVGVHRIEAGTPAALKEDAEAIREIADLGLKADIYAFARNMAADMKLAKSCGVDGVIAEMIGSEHLLEFGKRWTVERAIDACAEATAMAKDLGLKVAFFPADSSRADINWLMDFISGILDKGGHMDSMALVDTFGVLSPEGAAHRVRQLKKRFPNIPLEVHFHDDFGMGVSTTIAGFAAGAEIAHVTVNGIGERAGGAQLEAVALALKTMYGIDTGVDMTQFKSLSEFVAQCARMPVAKTKPIVGDDIFQWETGLPSSLWVNVQDTNPMIMLPYSWELTGHKKPHLLLSKKSGKDNVKTWLTQCNLTLPEEKIGEFLSVIKYKSLEEHRTLNEQDFRELYQKFTSAN